MQFGFQFETCIKTHVNILFNAALIQYTTVKFEFDTGNGKNEFISTNGILLGNFSSYCQNKTGGEPVIVKKCEGAFFEQPEFVKEIGFT